MDPGPVLIEETRNGRVQAMHHGHAVRVAADGTVARSWGDGDFPTYWRSSPKPLQAIPFAEVMADFGVGDDALALACASHSGELRHLELARAMLAAAGLDETYLRCAAHPPMTDHSTRSPDGQSAIHNNCSGKHAGMLAACVAHDWPRETYLEPDHPLQQRIVSLLEEATGRTDIPIGVDGCGVPTFWLPISDLARTYQWLDGHAVGRRCIDAMATHPFLVAGTERFCTRLGEATQGDCVGKVGAAGVYVILHRPSGGALAVKATGGDARVAESLAARIASEAGWIPDGSLEDILERPIKNCAGLRLGTYEVRL